MKSILHNKRALVAMSGGVDSSVAAAILKKQGYDVMGITLIVSEINNENGQIPDSAHIEDAKEVAKRLNIEYKVFDVSKNFKNEIVNYFINEYLNGRTPNPCVRCNKSIKFYHMYELAKEYNASFIATGHYALISKIRNIFLLQQALDKTKDQSYFLYDIPNKMLEKTILPLGNITKAKTRSIAKSLGLHIAEKKDSQEICFIKEQSYADFLVKNGVNVKPGPILTSDGTQIGMHKGIIYYTIGQRKGLNIPYAKPFYVIKIDAKNNAIYVGDEKDTYKDMLVANNFNWLLKPKSYKPLKIKAKIRYMSEMASALLEEFSDNFVKIKFEKPVKSVTPGQSVVIYKNNTVLGGGTICEKI